MRERFRLIITVDDRVRRNWSIRKSCTGEHVGEKSARSPAYYFLPIDTTRIAHPPARLLLPSAAIEEARGTRPIVHTRGENASRLRPALF